MKQFQKSHDLTRKWEVIFLLGAVLFFFASSAMGNSVKPVVVPPNDKSTENSEIAGATNPNEDIKKKFEKPGPETTDVQGRAGGASGKMSHKKREKKVSHPE